MPSGKQIRAARVLAGWGAESLAEKVGLSRVTIQNIENGVNKRPMPETMQKIVAAFDEIGIEFTAGDGVRRRDDTVQILEGSNAYLKMMDDVFYTTRAGGTVYFFCADDNTTTEGEIEAERRVRKNGVRFKCLIKEGNDVFRWDADEYRQIPASSFNHDLQVIYGDRVAQLIEGGQKILIIRNASLAQTERNKFDLIWPLMKPIKVKKNNDK
ncbi:MAG: helix-turn-helix transcriptional regulator [Bdellovibrionales bacterium]